MTEIGPEAGGKPGAIQRLLAGVPQGRGPAPVHLWNPAYCGEIDMRIAGDGTWHYNGSPINRLPMVQLFATILRKDPERYVLVTPVERVGIRVDDAPFLAVEVAREAGTRANSLFIRTSIDDVVELGADHAIRFTTAPDGGLKPYIHIRAGLWVLASRALTQELVDLATTETVGDTAFFGLRSGDHFFPIAPAEDMPA